MEYNRAVIIGELLNYLREKRKIFDIIGALTFSEMVWIETICRLREVANYEMQCAKETILNY